MLSPEFIEEMKQSLLQHQAQLEQELAGLSPHTELGGNSGDGYDQNAQEVELDNVSQDIIARIKQDLAKIAKALQKIEAGAYGTDDKGREISSARLRAIPWAETSI